MRRQRNCAGSRTISAMLWLSLAELKEPASEWLTMLDSGVTKALDINGTLRSYIRQHSATQR